MKENASCLYTEIVHSDVLAAVLMAQFAAGLLGNGVALWIFWFRMTAWKPSIIYLFNLSLADFLLIFCLPFRAHYFLKGSDWQLGDVPCRIMVFMISLNRAGSIFFLTLVAIDRYFKVVHPYHRVNSMTNSEATCLVVLMWSAIIGLTVYLLTKTHLISEVTNTTLCETFNHNGRISAFQIWHYFFFAAEFAVPLVVILYCTWSIVQQLRSCQLDRQGKIRRAVISVSVVSFVFVFCFLPSVVATLAVSITKVLQNCNAFQISCTMFFITLCLTYLNSVLNPLVFYFANPTFRSTLNLCCIANYIRKIRRR